MPSPCRTARTLGLTLGTYTDPQRLDTAAALEALPKMDGPKLTEAAPADAKELGVFLGGTGSTDRHRVSSVDRDRRKNRNGKTNVTNGRRRSYDVKRSTVAANDIACRNSHRTDSNR